MEKQPNLKAIRAAVALKAPRAPGPPKPPTDHTAARLRGRVTFCAKRVAAIDAAHAAIRAVVGTKQEWSERFHAINTICNETADRANLAAAQAALAAWLTNAPNAA